MNLSQLKAEKAQLEEQKAELQRERDELRAQVEALKRAIGVPEGRKFPFWVFIGVVILLCLIVRRR